MHSLGTAVHLALYATDIGIPDSVASSMRMADIVTEVNALAAYITFCHCITPPCRDLKRFYKHNIDILTKKIYYCKNFFIIF